VNFEIELVDSLRSYDAKEWHANPEVIELLGWKQKQSIQLDKSKLPNLVFALAMYKQEANR
jgi:hypothetical protein